jgi:hypothetical protein
MGHVAFFSKAQYMAGPHGVSVCIKRHNFENVDRCHVNYVYAIVAKLRKFNLPLSEETLKIYF